MASPVPIAELAEHAVAAGLAGEAEPATVYGRLLPALGLELGWDVALAWEVHEETDGPHLRCAADWAAAPAAAEPFVALSRALRLERGQGLPGRVWDGGEPVWLEDFGADRTLPRAVAAAPAGLRAALCLPTRAAGEVVGAIELLASAPRTPDPALLEAAPRIGERIGRFLEGRRAEDIARAGEAGRRAMFDGALDCVVTMDHRGRLIDFNPAAERTFGYRAADVAGREMAELIVPPGLRAAHRQGLARFLATGDGRMLDQRIEITGMRSTGQEFPVELTITRIRRDGPPLFTGYLRDITERKRAEAELRSSRARIVQAADEARRRLERDLHDGAQQRLVQVILELSLARNELARAPDEAARLLDGAAAHLREGLAELREFARGVHPVALTEGGLAAALPQLSRRSPVPVRLGPLPPERMPSAVEAAAYFFVSEGLANVARHAGATAADVGVALAGDHLTVEVADDGRGGADLGAGSGLRGLADRLSALDGSMSVMSPPGAGTIVTAVIPCAW